MVRVNGRRVAAYRDDGGFLSAVSPACTHLGCYVHWNTAERSWECPFHGSRFSPDGRVIAGPAERALAPVDMDSLPGAGNILPVGKVDGCSQELQPGT
jgi:Rieske Fe-S protein